MPKKNYTDGLPRKKPKKLVLKLCEDCHVQFTTSLGRFCDECRKERLRASAKRAREKAVQNLGKRYVGPEGYALITVLQPDGSVKHVPEHRYVMEQKLGRKLVTGESVHHKDGIRDNNDPDNLELWIGGIRYGQRAKDIKCPHCGQAYLDDSVIDDSNN